MNQIFSIMNLKYSRYLLIIFLLILFIQVTFQQESEPSSDDENNDRNEEASDEDNNSNNNDTTNSKKPPAFVSSSSYIALDGLNLVIIFDKPIDLRNSIESLESKVPKTSNFKQDKNVNLIISKKDNNQLRFFLDQCPAFENQLILYQQNQQTTESLVHGIQICAKLLTKKSLKLLHKYKLNDCIWTSRVQFVIKLSKSIQDKQVQISFQRNSLSHALNNNLNHDQELTIELSKLPLETLGLPLTPRLALTGPNQVPPCGQFALSAHLSSPYGTSSNESVRLSWSVGLVGGTLISSTSNGSTIATLNNSEQSLKAALIVQQQTESKWKSLQQLVSNNKGNNLVLDSRLFNQSPQLYEFKVTVSFLTSLTRVSLNASLQISKLDYETPIGTIYGSHLLSQQPLANTNQELLLLADIQVPECASNVKQVGLYWQVSDPRVRFEQTYAPYYLARSNSLPEQSNIEFRLNSFYGIRVKKYASSGTFVGTGDAILDASISDGLLVMSRLASDDENKQLTLYASSMKLESDKYAYQWSCFDGKTAQPCYKSSKSTNINPLIGNNTRYEITNQRNSNSGTNLNVQGNPNENNPNLLVDKSKQRQPVLKIPLSWLESDAQLWFGLQRFDRLIPSQMSKTEYALVIIQTTNSNGVSGEDTPVISIGPVLIGTARHRTSIRNPLTGAVILMADSPAVIIGRLGPAKYVKAFSWHSPSHIQPLNWITRSVKNPLTGENELETELHLGDQLQVAHAHLQINLSACAPSGAQISASLNLDVLQGVSQCKVEVSVSSLTSSLLISVDYCNIPLGLSPITYQIYMVNTFVSDSIIETSRQSDSTEDFEVNELDEKQMELEAEPLTVPQLSPVFRISESSAFSLMRLAKDNQLENQILRFAARVCNRLQACKMFYSNPVKINQLLGQIKPELVISGISSQTSNNKSWRPLQSESKQSRALLQTLQSLQESGRRANLAGNSIAAISIVNGALGLAQRMLPQGQQVKLTNLQDRNSSSQDDLSQDMEKKTREYLLTAIKDSLQFGYQSTQRQFHYSDSGQTSLVTQIMTNILKLPQSNLEHKFRAMRIIALLTRRSIMEQVNLKSMCLADPKRLQAAYEAILNSFSHYHIIQDHQTSWVGSDKNHRDHHSHGSRRKQQLSTSSSTLNPFNGISMAVSNSSSSGFLVGNGAGRSSSEGKDVVVVVNNNVLPATPLNSASNGNKANRRKREEAILAYLKSLRQAYRALISSSAIQLPLGSSQQLKYSSLDHHHHHHHINRQTDSDNKLSTSRSQLGELNVENQSTNNNSSTTTTTTTTSQQKQQAAKLNTLPSEITSSLMHLSTRDLGSLLRREIELDLNEFGKLSIRFQESLANKLGRQLDEQRLRCRNDTSSKCSSVVLAITTFAGKAPFRALDESSSLRVPALEVNLLSPLDGSNLLDLLTAAESATGSSSISSSSSSSGTSADSSISSRANSLNSDDFKTYVTFRGPQKQQQQQTNDSFQPNEASERHRNVEYKCYFFDEDSNEWVISPFATSNEQQPVTDSLSTSCTFDTFGTYAVFKGKPPPSDTSVSLSIGLGVLIVISLAGFLSLLGCFASSSRASRARNNSSSSIKTNSEQEDSSSTTNTTYASSSSKINSRSRHPEQSSYRNNFNYPLS